MAMAARAGERAALLPQIDEWGAAAVQVASNPEDSRQRCQRAAARRTSVRQDVWTLLHYRASIRNRTGLLRWSYAIEVAVLVLISANVALAMWFSSAVAGGAAADALLSGSYDTLLTSPLDDRLTAVPDRPNVELVRPLPLRIDRHLHRRVLAAPLGLR